MTEERIPYTSNSDTHIRYPGSSLEVLVEALTDLEVNAEQCYTPRVAKIHSRLKDALRGQAEPMTVLLREMLSLAAETK